MKTPHGAARSPYIREIDPESGDSKEERLRLAKMKDDPTRVRRGHSGDKLRRKAFEKKI